MFRVKHICARKHGPKADEFAEIKQQQQQHSRQTRIVRKLCTTGEQIMYNCGSNRNCWANFQLQYRICRLQSTPRAARILYTKSKTELASFFNKVRHANTPLVRQTAPLPANCVFDCARTKTNFATTPEILRTSEKEE